jgi:hypothetical protein
MRWPRLSNKAPGKVARCGCAAKAFFTGSAPAPAAPGLRAQQINCQKYNQKLTNY